MNIDPKLLTAGAAILWALGVLLILWFCHEETEV